MCVRRRRRRRRRVIFIYTSLFHETIRNNRREGIAGMNRSMDRIGSIRPRTGIASASLFLSPLFRSVPKTTSQGRRVKGAFIFFVGSRRRYPTIVSLLPRERASRERHRKGFRIEFPSCSAPLPRQTQNFGTAHARRLRVSRLS